MKRSLVPLSVCVVLGACSTYGPGALRAGLSEPELRTALGEPTARRALPAGAAAVTRLEYARGPMGKHTFMVDLDASGHVTQWQQVLTDAQFDRVLPGLSRDELLLQLGRPAEKRGIWRGGEVWAWRYESPFCLWFQVTLREGRVFDSGRGPDPSCEDRERREFPS